MIASLTPHPLHRHPDIYVSNSGANKLFRNNGDGTFSDATTAAGVGHTGLGRGLAVIDTNKDGNLDIYLVIVNGANVLLRTSAASPPTGTFLVVRPLDNSGRPDLFGSKVYLFPAGSSFSLSSDELIGMRLIDGGSGYNSQR